MVGLHTSPWACMCTDLYIIITNETLIVSHEIQALNFIIATVAKYDKAWCTHYDTSSYNTDILVFVCFKDLSKKKKKMTYPLELNVS